MFLHRKELIQPVNVGTPDARFGTYFLEQFGGATGELTAALQYWVQSFHVENAGIRDMLQDIAIEEFSHLEMVGKLIAQHTSELDQTSIHDAPLFKLKGGGPHFLDSQGSCWTAAYIQEGGNVVRDLRANISAEAGARQTYESLIKACDGSVATILTKDARRWWAGSDRSCGPVEQVGDKGGLAADIMTVNLSNLSLPHHRHGLETRQRLPRRTETAEAEPRPDKALDTPVVLLDDVVQIFTLSQTSAAP